MVVNQSARNCQLLIGGYDYTPCFISLQGSDSHLDQSSLITFSGTILLGKAIGFGESLDDRINTTRFCRGTVVTLRVANSSGTLVLHPRGAMRILAPKYDTDKQQMSLEVGDLIGLMRFKEPIDSVAFDRFLVAGIASGGGTSYTDPILDYVAGYDRPLSTLVSTLLNRAGISGYSGSVPSVIYNNPLNLGGSYLDSVGKLLYANNCYAWIDNEENFKIEPVALGAGSGISLTIGNDEIWYRRLDGSESPCEVINAVGSGTFVYPANFLDDVTTQFGLASSVDPTYPNTVIVMQLTTKTQDWEKTTHTLTVTTTTERPAGLVVDPSLIANSILFKLLLTISEVDIEISYYENNYACKLKSKVTQTYTLAGSFLAEYVAANSSTEADYYALVLTKQVTKSYTYDLKDRVSQIVTTTQQAAVTVLNGTGEEWTKWTSPPEYLVNSQIETETYKEISKGVWDYRVDTLACLVVVNPALVKSPDGSGSGPLSNKLQLIYSPPSSDTRSNSGQVNPPSPERCPADVRLEEIPLKQQAFFADPCPTVLRQRERTFNVDFLAGQTVPVPLNGGPSNAISLTTANAQLLQIARREGTLLWGRYKGQEIASALLDGVLSYYPLIPINCTEQSGTIQYYLVDGASWVITPQKCLWSCDGIWVGSGVSGGGVTTYYTQPEQFQLGQGWGIQINSYPYSTTGTTEQFQLGQGWGIQIQLGEWDPMNPIEWDDLDPNTWDTLD